jgi:serine/threonine protein phosphatase PrpC
LTDEKLPAEEVKQTLFYYHYAGLTDTGLVRDHNEDAYKLPSSTNTNSLANKGHLYVLADGMGGHQQGEVASAITIETINSAYYNSALDIQAESSEDVIISALTGAIEEANLKVMDATQGGGTTVVAAVFYEDMLISMNVGDSRAYLLRDNELHLVSRDHSMVARLVELGKITEEEALNHPRRNVLYQALGQGSDLEIHVAKQHLQLNDVVIICSDGLWGEVSDTAIKEVLKTVDNPLNAIRKLITMANETGGPDNITAIVVQVLPEVPPEDGYGSQEQSPLAYNVPDLDDTHPSMPVVKPHYEKPASLPETDSDIWVD